MNHFLSKAMLRPLLSRSTSFFYKKNLAAHLKTHLTTHVALSQVFISKLRISLRRETDCVSTALLILIRIFKLLKRSASHTPSDAFLRCYCFSWRQWNWMPHLCTQFLPFKLYSDRLLRVLPSTTIAYVSPCSTSMFRVAPFPQFCLEFVSSEAHLIWVFTLVPPMPSL